MIKEASPSNWRHEVDAAGVVNLDMPFGPGKGSETTFFRADLIFTGVDHSGLSYEVRVYLNNPRATATTPRTSEEGYAARFAVFGHGNCFGEAGHCEVSATVSGQAGSVRWHPTTSLKVIGTNMMFFALAASVSSSQGFFPIGVLVNPNKIFCAPELLPIDSMCRFICPESSFPPRLASI